MNRTHGFELIKFRKVQLGTEELAIPAGNREGVEGRSRDNAPLLNAVAPIVEKA
jgi:hypothetical protein